MYRAPQSADMYLSFAKQQTVELLKVDENTGTGLRGAELTLSNPRKGLTISKIDAATGKALSGARVEIRDSEDNVIA